MAAVCAVGWIDSQVFVFDVWVGSATSVWHWSYKTLASAGHCSVLQPLQPTCLLSTVSLQAGMWTISLYFPFILQIPSKLCESKIRKQCCSMTALIHLQFEKILQLDAKISMWYFPVCFGPRHSRYSCSRFIHVSALILIWHHQQ